MHVGHWWESQKERIAMKTKAGGGVDNIKIDLREIGWCDMDWIDLADDRDQSRVLVNTVMNFRVP
jgi:hypothetical protein